MRQPLKGNGKTRKTAPKRPQNRKKEHPKYGTSKLEARFAEGFLKKLGLMFVYQYHAKEIGRYYDFVVVSTMRPEGLVYEERCGVISIDDNNSQFSICFAIEIDGERYHSNGRKYNELTSIQKRSVRVDEIKDEYCRIKRIPLLRIRENDINHNPKKVMDMLKEHIRNYCARN